jgi:plastocyanin
MTRRIALLIALTSAVLVVVALFAGPAGAKSRGGLTGEVGPGFQIKMRLDGKAFTTLKSGIYRIKIEDKANIHNFHLTGPGLNKSTSVGGTTETAWTVRLKKGVYRYVCDPHASQMKGSFTVT